MSWVVAAVSVGTAAYGAYSGYKANKDAKAAQQEQMAAVDGANFGRRPEAALYEPINFDDAARNQILQNFYNLDEVNKLVRGGNHYITKDALKRAEKLIPGYSASMQKMGLNANQLISGQVPSDVLSQLVSDRAGVSNGVNIPGLAGAATAKDLGLTSLDMIGQGSNLMGKMVSMAETISPRSSYMSPKDYLLSPQERIALEMNQRQLVQQSEQNKNFLEAGADPTEMARLGVRLGQPHIPAYDWSGAAGSMGMSLLGAYNQSQAGRGLNSSGGYDSVTGMYKAAPYSSGYSYSSGIGYVPRAGAL